MPTIESLRAEAEAWAAALDVPGYSFRVGDVYPDQFVLFTLKTGGLGNCHPLSFEAIRSRRGEPRDLLGFVPPRPDAPRIPTWHTIQIIEASEG